MESGKQQIKEVRSKIQPENSETKAIPKRVWIRPEHSSGVATQYAALGFLHEMPPLTPS